VTRSRDPHAWPPRSGDDFRQEAVIRLGEELADRLARVRLLVFDADGVLTPGNLIYGPRGEAYKEFHAHDGLGLVLARAVGLKRAVLTGRNSAIVERRATELRFDAIKLGRFDKQAALAEILAETGVDAASTLYMGDDLIDLPAMFEVGVAVGVPAAPAEVREHCDYVTAAPGGAGAVREVCDLVLKAAGLFGDALRRVGEKAWMPTPEELSSDDDGGKPPGVAH
jgi:3-deoxy-D-manno-octulosonate 8-phosphate phosphatase (KDO 8-P phosphatase)